MHKRTGAWTCASIATPHFHFRSIRSIHSFPHSTTIHSGLPHTTTPPFQPPPHHHPSTPSLRPFKSHSPTGSSRPPPSPTANTRNKCRLHQYVCIADVWTPTHFTLLQPPIPAPCRSTLFHPVPIQSIPSHPTLVECGQLNSTHHCMLGDMHAGQGRQAGGKAS